MLLLFTASGHSARKLLRIFSILRHKSFGAGKFILTFGSPVWQSNILKVKCRRKNNGKMFFTLGWFPAFIVATNRKHFISENFLLNWFFTLLHLKHYEEWDIMPILCGFKCQNLYNTCRVPKFNNGKWPPHRK